MLKAEGNQVQEFYIVDYPPDFNPFQGNGVDGKLRTKIYDHNIEIIDLHRNPRFDPLKIVKDSLIDFSNYNSEEL